MKNLITRSLIFTMFVFTIVSCKNVKKEHHNHDGHHSEMNQDANNGQHDQVTSDSTSQSAISTSSQKDVSMAAIIDAYFQIKNGLVADNKNEAAAGGEALLKAFSAVDMSKLTDESHKEYMEIYESAKEQAEHIVKSPIAHQREHFEALSTDVNDLISLLGTDKTVYQDFCPMANNGKGAYWLSEIKEIKNPYFGAKMMKCGSVKNQIN